MRGFAEGTIYGHLFKAGVLDPEDYITEEEMSMAKEIYFHKEEYDSPSEEISKFLDDTGKAAFYYLLRNT